MSDKNSYESARDDFLAVAGIFVILAIAVAIAYAAAIIAMAVFALAGIALVALLRGVYLLLAWYTFEARCLKKINKLEDSVSFYDRWIAKTEREMNTLTPSDALIVKKRVSRLRESRLRIREELRDVATAWLDFLADKAEKLEKEREAILSTIAYASREHLNLRLRENEEQLSPYRRKMEELEKKYDIRPDPKDQRLYRKYPLLKDFDEVRDEAGKLIG